MHWDGLGVSRVVGDGIHSPGSDENADVSFAEHVLEGAAVDNHIPGKVST